MGPFFDAFLRRLGKFAAGLLILLAVLLIVAWFVGSKL